jgi:hypothetical protein
MAQKSWFRERIFAPAESDSARGILIQGAAPFLQSVKAFDDNLSLICGRTLTRIKAWEIVAPYYDWTVSHS